MTRREFPAKVKVAAFERAGKTCEGCRTSLRPSHIHYDHIIPDALGGEPTLDNCAVLCTACHGSKTAREDVPNIARAKRLEAKHIGAKAPSRAVMPGSKRSPWRKRLSGEVVRRDAE